MFINIGNWQQKDIPEKRSSFEPEKETSETKPITHSDRATLFGP